MHGRMSRLRRSLSRSVLQLHAIQALSRSHSNLPDPIGTSNNKDNAELVQKFAFRDLVQANNDNLRDIIAVFEERVAIDSSYSKSLHKLAARLHKIGQKAECEIDMGWTSAAEQFDMQATIHSNLSSAFSDDIVQPLKAIQINEDKNIRATSLFVDKQLKQLKEKKADTARAKRSAYTAAKELERLEQTADADRTNTAKYANRRKKLQDTVKKAEDEYIFESIDQEKIREMAEKVLQRAVGSLEGVERQRLEHSQTALGRLQRKIQQMGPSMSTMFNRQTANLEVATSSSPSSFLSSLVPSTASPANHVTLVDTYAENFAEVMRPERRAEALKRTAATLDSELQRMYSLARAEDVRSNQIYIEYLYHKVGEARESLEGMQSTASHRLAKYQHRIGKDKQGLPQTVLSIPLAEGTDTLALPGLHSPGTSGSMSPPLMSGPSSSPSFIPPPSPSFTVPSEIGCYEDYEKISDEGFYNAASRQSTVIDDPATDDVSTVAKAVYDFLPTSEEELEIRAGESVVVESRLGGDWLIGRILSPIGRPRPEKTGRFPATYVSFCESSIML